MNDAALGIDIGSRAWTVVELTAPRAEGRVQLAATCAAFDSILDCVQPGKVAIIDVPIGLLDDEDASRTDKGKSGDRDVDKGARKWCPSTSSVFPPPTKQQLASALAEHRRARSGKTKDESKRRLSNVEPGGISRQTLELVPAIDAAGKLKQAFPEHVFEGHPEVVFSALAEGVLPWPKSSLAGALARASILQRWLDVDVVSWAIGQECSTGVAADNWLDALALAVVAIDWSRGHRKILKTRDGRVHTWVDEADGIMALPSTERCDPPPRLERDRAMAVARTTEGSKAILDAPAGEAQKH